MDIIRYDFCRMDLPDTQPGVVGTWNGSDSGSYEGALLYDPDNHESYTIASDVLTSQQFSI